MGCLSSLSLNRGRVYFNIGVNTQYIHFFTLLEKSGSNKGKFSRFTIAHPARAVNFPRPRPLPLWILTETSLDHIGGSEEIELPQLGDKWRVRREVWIVFYFTSPRRTAIVAASVRLATPNVARVLLT
jgi:hypothetical protein